jgi:GT2 family glycosyltransferase
MHSCVILLNWNGWRDTIECLESVFRLNSPDFRVVVCDNASADGSLEKVKQWARGELPAESANPLLSHLTLPSFPKPILYRELTREEAESGTAPHSYPLTLIQNGANVGFAAGNNVGLRYALGDPNCQFFWMLNNDTVVEPESLAAMVHLMEQRPEVGLCGSLNLSYYKPKEVQAQGGKTYCRWTARVSKPAPLTIGELDSCPAPMDFINGASMLASRAFLEAVGLMEESYFLYFEELDWAMRAKEIFELAYARESVIYHKEGAAIGSSPDRSKRSLVSDTYLSRSRVLFTKRFFPWALPSVLLFVLLSAAYRLCRGERGRARVMLSFMMQGLKLHVARTEKLKACK